MQNKSAHAKVEWSAHSPQHTDKPSPMNYLCHPATSSLLRAPLHREGQPLIRAKCCPGPLTKGALISAGS